MDTPLPKATALLGEVGLAGELRPVHNMEVRDLVGCRTEVQQAVDITKLHFESLRTVLLDMFARVCLRRQALRVGRRPS